MVRNAVGRKLNQPVGHLRRSSPVLSILEAGQRQFQLLRDSSGLARRKQPFRQGQMNVRVFRIIKHLILQLCNGVAEAELGRHQGQSVHRI
jgi:hypothetical protein